MKKGPEIVYQDDSILVINKPAGWLSIPDRNGSPTPCVSSYFEKSHKVFVIHRLDKETSGILILGKSEDAHRKISFQFMDRKVVKTYRALLHGDLREKVEVDAPLQLMSNGKVKVSPQGKSAQSIFTPVARFGEWTWVEVEIKTGRTHQIRVHAQHIGHAVVSDPLYGNGQPLTIELIKRLKPRHEENRGCLLKRTGLHAHGLKIEHPDTGESIAWTAPLPKDLRASLNQLEKWRNLKVN